jgi:N-acetyl-alpha-D-muramate 1-phosphate uridylyltransferase
MKAAGVMVFAAGLGTRMGALTRDRPKALVPVAGRPLIDHALDLIAPGLPAVLNLHYRADMLAAHLRGRGVQFSDESDLLRETGGGLRHALPLFAPGPVLTLNADAVWSGPNPLDLLQRAWDPVRMEALLMLVPRDRALGHPGAGDFLQDGTGRLTRGPGAVYSGAQLIRPEPVLAMPETVFSLNPVWDRIAGRGRLFGLIYPGRWCDVGRPDSIPLAEALLADVS